MTAYALRPTRKGTREEAARVLADLRRLARPTCEECGQPATHGFGIVRFCAVHAAQAMNVAYAMEVTL